MKRVMAIVSLLFFVSIAFSQEKISSLPAPSSILQKDTWMGFQRIHFSIAGRKAYYVQPEKVLSGRPWVWRASFPNWHAAMDSILLSRGFHIFFVEVDNQYGSPYAMQVWDKCYYYLTDSLSFAPKVALEGVSRGGLYVYGWAKRNPDKISCIYNEAPVCDINSWPAGKGKGRGDSATWAQCREILGLTEETAATYTDIPLKNLEGLAAFKVPVLHVISNADRVVPADENTYPFVKNYTALGGPATIYPVTKGPQDLWGHHFPVEHPGEWAEFIYQHSYPVQEPVKNDQYIKKKNGLENFIRATRSKKEMTVAFVGGSITYNKGWRDKTSNCLQEMFPDITFHFINAGIPSLGSLPHVFRLQSELPQLPNVDLMFLESAVNDRANGTDSLTQLLCLEGIIRQAKKANPAMDMIMMSFADPEKMHDYSMGKTPAEVANHERVAAHYGIPSINLAGLVTDKINNGEFSWPYDFKDLHPSPFGQEIYFSAIKRLLFTSVTAFHSSQAENRQFPVPLNKGSYDGAGTLDIHQVIDRKNFTIDEKWQPEDGLSTREGFVQVPVLSASKPGAGFSLSFTGNTIGIAIVSGADAGMIEYAVDGKKFKPIDLYTKWSSQLHLPWYIILADGLKDKPHTLRIRISEQKNNQSKGYACRIVTFLVNR